MKHSAFLNNYLGLNTYDDVIDYFEDIVLVNGDVFFYEFGKFVEEEKIGDQVVLNAFGISNGFSITIRYETKDVMYVEIKKCGNDILKATARAKTEGILDNAAAKKVEKYFDNLNKEIYNNWKNKCGIKESNNILVDRYRNYELSDTITLSGSIEEIFDQYVTFNDRMRYINGTYYRFHDKDIKKLYDIFIASYNGNYFLDNAVKRGCIID